MIIDYSQLGDIHSVLAMDEDDWNNTLACYASSDHNGLVQLRLLRQAPEDLTVRCLNPEDPTAGVTFHLFGVLIAMPEQGASYEGMRVAFRVSSQEARVAAEAIVRAEVNRLCELYKLVRTRPTFDKDQLVLGYADATKVPALLAATRR